MCVVLYCIVRNEFVFFFSSLLRRRYRYKEGTDKYKRSRKAEGERRKPGPKPKRAKVEVTATTPPHNVTVSTVTNQLPTSLANDVTADKPDAPMTPLVSDFDRLTKPLPLPVTSPISVTSSSTQSPSSGLTSSCDVTPVRNNSLSLPGSADVTPSGITQPEGATSHSPLHQQAAPPSDSQHHSSSSSVSSVLMDISLIPAHTSPLPTLTDTTPLPTLTEAEVTAQVSSLGMHAHAATQPTGYDVMGSVNGDGVKSLGVYPERSGQAAPAPSIPYPSSLGLPPLTRSCHGDLYSHFQTDFFCGGDAAHSQENGGQTSF